MNGKIIISYVTCNTEDDYVSLRVEDETSRIEFLSVNLSPEQYGMLLSASRHVDCTFDLRGVDRVGMIAENDTVDVNVANYCTTDEVEIKCIKRDVEVDGWGIREGDLQNSHNYRRHPDHDDIYLCTVVRFRWVKP